MAASDPDPRSDPRARSTSGWLEAAALADRLEEEIVRAERQGSELSCLLVVIESLQEMERRYGADLGEQALSHLARALRGELRRFDQVGRPSERELLVVLPNADSTHGEIVARRALGRLRTIKIEADGVRRTLPISIGLTDWRTGLSASKLLAAARAAAGTDDGGGETEEAQAQVVRWLSPAALVGAIAGANVVAATAGSVAGAVCHALLLLAALNVYAFAPSKLGSRAALVLALASLAGLMSLALPTSDASPIAREATVAALLLVGLALVSKLVALERTVFVLRRRELPGQLLVALCGLPIGLLGWRILAPHPLASPGNVAEMALAAAVLAFLTAPALELLFRWALQAEMIGLYGPAGIALVNLLFASVYAGTQSLGFVVLMGATGVCLSLAVTRTGRIWGPIGAHALIGVGVFVVWPAVL